MKYLRKFNSVSDMETAIASAEVDFIGLAYDNGTPKLNITVPAPDPKTIPFYIEDISGSENTVLIMKNNSSAPTLTIEKSTDGETWETMGTTSGTAISTTVPANGKVYLRCSTNSWGSGIYANGIGAESRFNVGGNIMSLLYGSNFTGEETTFPTGSSYNFNRLFYNRPSLVNASDLILPATTLTTYCYNMMFYGCTSLTTVPTLLATTLAIYCYKGMFQNCTSLTTAPALPATTLTRSCYEDMFNGCTALTTAPSLPATTMEYYSYTGMFRGCTALTTAPVLPATTLYGYCYSSMFYGCTALTTVPELPATTLYSYCYASMFQGCTNLNYIKCLATDISASSCTDNWVTGVAASGTFVKNPLMSSWTTGGNGIPSGWSTQDSIGIYFKESTNSITIKTVNLDLNTGYYTINDGTHIPLTMSDTVITITEAMNGQTLLAHGEFNGEVMEESITLKYVLPFYIEDVSGVENTIEIKKTNAGATTITVEKSTDCVNWTTIGSTSTTAITATIPANGKLYLRCNTNGWGSYNYINYINITGDCNVGGNIMSLLYGSNFTGNETTFKSAYVFKQLFKQNTHIINASELILPATTLTEGCYQYMFQGCTSLTTAPELPATTLAISCYQTMFYNCSSLNYIKCLATSISAVDCVKNWVYNVAASGTFVKNPSMSSWTTGNNGIPEGWTVEDATA